MYGGLRKSLRDVCPLAGPRAIKPCVESFVNKKATLHQRWIEHSIFSNAMVRYSCDTKDRTFTEVVLKVVS